MPVPLIELKEKTAKRNCLPWELRLHQTKITGCELITIASLATVNVMTTQKDKASGKMNHVLLVMNNCLTKECGMTFLVKKEHTTLCVSTQSLSAIGYPHDEDKIWWIANTKVEGIMSSKILEIKNNPLKPVNIILIPNLDTFLDLKAGPEEFHEHYQNLALTREKQEQCLVQTNTQLCDHCLIPYDFQYCNEYDLIYNPPLYMIYIIPEEKEPISSCASESESNFNPDLNSDNNDNKNNNSNSDLNYKQYIMLSDLTKEQELKWFNDNNKSIMPECMHDTNTEFNLRYLGKNAIKLEPYLHTCINLKIALEILTTIMVQLASRSSLAKKGINIRGEIIDAEYVRNIIAMLQNDSEKAYVIKPNEKIAQAIFLGIQGFESMNKINIPVNIAKEEIVNKGEIISICQLISIPSYDQYMLIIKREIKNQAQLFEAEATIFENQPPNYIPDFSQLCGYVDIISQTIYRQSKCYLLQPEQLEQINLGNLDPL
ncbi:hypothetical protein G9A89_010860 [Geosiphon pyriformis]|nr:hypothetical protein G9A89_010860 [Geosiphon pyriformis]